MKVSVSKLFDYPVIETKNFRLVGPGTSHPIGFTLDEIIYLHWKVKTIRITYSETLNFSTTGDSFEIQPENILPHGSPPFDFEPNSVKKTNSSSSLHTINTAEDERYLVCNYHNGHSIKTGEPIYFSVKFSNPFGSSLIYFYLGKYYPYIVFNSGSFTSLKPEQTPSQILQSAARYGISGNYEAIGRATLNITGSEPHAIPIYQAGISFFAGSYITGDELTFRAGGGVFGGTFATSWLPYYAVARNFTSSAFLSFYAYGIEWPFEE
jgi:hypothetical protein